MSGEGLSMVTPYSGLFTKGVDMRLVDPCRQGRRALLAIAISLLTVGGAGAEAAAPILPKAMVAAANPEAVEAGLAILRRGGSALDAAVAVQATLGLVEPQSSGVGGGAFLSWYDPKSRKVTAYDGREFAPAGATRDMFLKADGKPLSYGEAVLSGRSAGAPGAVAMLYLAHKDHGRLAWSSLFAGSEQLAESGFLIGPRLVRWLNYPLPQNTAPDVIAYFKRPDGAALKAGDRLKNPAYAQTLRRIAAEGPNALLKGGIAADIVARLARPPLPGTMTLADLAAYAPIREPALCRPYRVWTICAPPAPSGGPATLEGLGLLENTDIASRGPTDPVAWSELAQAERLMYADDLRYIGDPAFVTAPIDGLLDRHYLADRAKSIGDRAGPAPEPGHPAGAPVRGPDATKEPGGTSSFVVVDRWGGVVAMTTTIESVFGDGRMVDGFFLNNQLTDFSFSPLDKDGAPAANAVGPRKRPRSSMSPVIILDKDGRFVAAMGSPGGLAIPAYVLKGVVGSLDWKLPLTEVLALPNLIAMGDRYISEPKRYAPGVVDGLAARGIVLQSGFGAEDSGLHAVIARPGGLEGGADPRREGVARGCCEPSPRQGSIGSPAQRSGRRRGLHNVTAPPGRRT
jgi:gamma-glutamyltranspeptidase/glutathione hydrolase